MLRRRQLAVIGQPVLSDTRPKMHQVRDGMAALKIVQALARPGDETPVLFNAREADLSESAVRGRFRAGDLMLVNTRLDMNAVEKHLHKRVPCQDTWLEKQVLAGWSRFFTSLSRKRVCLTPRGAGVLAPGFHPRSIHRFNARHDHARLAGSRIPRTAGYLVYTRELWPGGPACLSIFGMSGEVTLGLASAIQERCWKELEFDGGDELVVVEISAAGDPLLPDAVQGYCDYWQKWTLTFHRGGRANPRTYAPPRPGSLGQVAGQSTWSQSSGTFQQAHPLSWASRTAPPLQPVAKERRLPAP